MIRRKKSQMEIFGLAIIVLLVTLSLIFTVQFIYRRKAPEHKQVFIETQLASNTLSALLSTTSDCRDLSVRELIEDCYGSSPLRCDSENSTCNVSEAVIKSVFNRTLDVWNKKYSFNTYLKEDCTGSFKDCLIVFEKNCTFDMPKESKNFKLYTKSGILTVKLDVCSS